MFFALRILGCLKFSFFMKKRVYVSLCFIVTVVVIGFFSFHSLISNDSFPRSYSYTVVATIPHDMTAFTEGLVFTDGLFYESCGGWGTSSLREVNLTGIVIREVMLSEQYFAEGLALVNGSLVQLTWQSGVGFVYDLKTFKQTINFYYSTEGWGLTFDGTQLIMSDGSSTLYFLDPATFQIVGQVSVHDADMSIDNLNELEYVDGDIYANIWHQQKIAIINPTSGEVKGYIDLTGIYITNNSESVLNGIAYDQETGNLYVTGKNWPNLYQITIAPIT
jgi:glutamine cyclotransferase